jgi:glycosyltransferase involved in cell wall biosynthesis
MKRILLLSRGGYLGGSQQQLRYVVAGLDRERYEPVVVCRGDGQFVGALRADGVEAHVLPLRPWRTWPAALRRGRVAHRLARLARRCRAALIHSSDLWLSGYLSRVARTLRLPSVLHVRMPLPPADCVKHRCGRADVVIAISDRIRSALLAAGVPREKVALIRDGVDVARFRPAEGGDNVLRREYPQAEGVLVGIVGRIDAFKRQQVFVEAAARVLSETAGAATFFVVGEVHSAAYARGVERQVAAGGLEGRVVLTGRRDDMPEVLAALDVLVTLSGGSVMIEAMACGTPVISAGFSRAAESVMVQPGRTGLLVESAEPAALAGAMRRLIGSGELRRRMARDARAWAEERFVHTEMVRRTEQVYEGLLG